MGTLKRFYWLTVVPAIMLLPGIVLAADKEPSAKDLPLSGPVGSVVGQALDWIKIIVTPDGDLWWLWLITFPLTIIWMIWSSPKMKQAFNTAGGVIACGLPALAILLAFYGLILGIGFRIFGGFAAIANFAMNPSLPGFLNALWRIIGLIGIFVVIWLIGMIPGAKDAIMKVLGLGATLARKVWGLREHSKKNPGPVYQILGAAVIAGVINGALVTNSTGDGGVISKAIGHSLIPGIFPAISAGIGLFFLGFRTIGGQRMIAKIQNKPGPGGSWVCDGQVYKHNKKGEIYFRGVKEPVHYKKLPQMLAQGLKPIIVTCGTKNLMDQGDYSCRSDFCNQRSRFLSWDCLNPDCKETNIPYDKFKCKCGTRQPERPVALPCTPDTDDYSRLTDEELAVDPNANTATGFPTTGNYFDEAEIKSCEEWLKPHS